MASDFWNMVRGELEDDAAEWWCDHEDLIGDLQAEAWEKVAVRLAEGEPAEAAIDVALRMDREAWRAYLSGTTSALQQEAQQLTRLYKALAGLSTALAKTIGKALVGAGA